MADIVDTFIARLRSEGEADIRKAREAVNALAAAQDKATASSDKAAAANRNVAASAGVVSIADEKITRAKRSTTNELERWIGRMDRASRVTQTYRNDLARLQRLEEEQVGTENDRAFALALVTRRMEEGIAATKKATVATNDNTKATATGTTAANTHRVSVGSLNAAVTSFGFQVNDIATSLASGGSPFTILAQQGGQIVQAFSQGGGPTAVLSAFGRTLAGLITPMRLLGVGVLAVGGALALLASREAETEGRLRSYGTLLDTMGAKSETTAAQLDAVTKSLRDQGVALDDADKAVRAIIQTPGVNRAATGQLAQLALDISGARKTDVAGEAAALARAVSGTTAELEKYNEERIRYTEAERKAIDQSKLARNEDEQRMVMYGALTRSFATANEKNKSEWQKHVDELKKNWNEFLDVMGKPALAVVTSFFERFNEEIKNTKKEIQLLIDAWNWLKSKMPSWDGDDPTGARAAAKAQQGGARGGTDWKGIEEDLNLIDKAKKLVGAAAVQKIIDENKTVEDPAVKDPKGTDDRGKNILGDQAADIANRAKAYGLLGRAAAEADARVAALAQVQNMAMSPAEKAAFVTAAVADALNKYDKTAQATLTTQDRQTEGIQKVTAAYLEGEIPGLKAAAQAQAELDVRTGNALNVEARRQQLLEAGATEAVNAAAKQLPVLGQQLKASERLATATADGTAAEHAAVLENQVAAATHDALSKAIVSGNPALIAQAEAVTKGTAELIKRNDVLQQTYQLEQQNNQRTNQIAVLELTAKLQGETTEEIARQVALLQAKQDLDARGITNGMAIYEATLKNVEALAQANIKTAEAERGQKRLEDAVKSVADTVTTDLSQAMGDAFSGKKVTDWGATVKSTITSIIQSIATSAIIKPLIGTVLAGLGFGNLAKDFGSIGTTISAIESIGGSSSSSTTAADTVGTAVKSGGFLKDLFSTGGELGFLGDIGRTSIFGSSTTIGSAATGVGLGFGAGTLLNTFTGGNRTTGTIGSGVGSLAGTAIGALFGAPIVGGLLGGAAGGLLGGLFGGSKKPNNASGGYINLATGEIVGARSGGNAANDRTAIEIGKALSDTVVKLLKLPGAALPAGTLGVEAGSRDGIKLSYAGQTFKFADASAAIAGGLVALRDNLTGVSETVQKVLHGISDIDELDAALTFAETYDKIAEAADSAFADIEDSTVGPFAAAFDEINTVFDEVIANAEKFGLSLDPVNEALAEATRRLNEDFSKAVDRAFNDASESGFLNDIADIIEGYKSMAADADAIGASRAVTDKLNQTANKEISAVLDTLTGAELDQVLEQFGDLAITDLPALAAAARDVAVAAETAADALERSTAAYQIQQDYDTAGGEGFLAQLRDLDKARKETLDTIADLKLDDSLKALAAETEHRAALTILQELTNEQLETARDLLEDLNPAFGAWVDEAKDLVKVAKAAADAEEAHTAALAAGIRIRQYLNAQETTEELNSPADRLASARSQFATQLGLAQGGDVKALENITGAADELKQAIIAWFASSAPGSQEWEDAKAALALLPGVPSADEKSTNAIITAIEEAAETTSTATTTAASASAKQIIDVAISTNAKIVDNARVAASDIIVETGESSYRIVASTIESSNAIVQNGIESSARIAGATTTSLEFTTAATRDVAVAAAATTAAVKISTSTAEGGTLALLASNAANAETLIAGSQEDTRALLAQQEANAAELIAANVAQSAALIDQNELNAAATVTATNTTAASIVAGNTSTAKEIINTAVANTEAVRVTANDNTNSLIWTANATSDEVAARNEAAAYALLLKTEEGTYTTAGTVAAWSKLVLDYNWLASRTIWETVAAWGAAIAATVREWGNATVSTIGYWGQADINYQVWAGNGIIYQVAAGTNAVTNSIYAASTTTIAAIYGSASNDIAATYSNGNAIIGAISSASITATAATYSSANSIVAQVYAAGSSGAVYSTGYQISLEIINMSNRMAAYLALVVVRIERSNDLLQALANLLVAGLDQIDSELATINDNAGANTRVIVNAIG